MTILDKIVADTRELVSRRKQRIPIHDLEESPFFGSPALPIDRALRGSEMKVIAEIKKASPSQGVIRTDYEVDEIAREYKMNEAAAVSVLTEPGYFQGSLKDLATARRTIDLPLLRKDFIVDSYQLYEARSYGADAVLLIAAVLDASELKDLHTIATDLGLSCLVEVHHIGELDKIDFDQVRVLGVNNRDLHTFEVDISHSLKVFKSVPGDIVRVSESGLKTAADLAHLRRNGIDAVLIGETFMRTRNPGLALSKLLSEVRSILQGTGTTLRLAMAS